MAASLFEEQLASELAQRSRLKAEAVASQRNTVVHLAPHATFLSKAAFLYEFPRSEDVNSPLSRGERIIVPPVASPALLARPIIPVARSYHPLKRTNSFAGEKFLSLLFICF